jgi:carbon monoxide dehydrogenase subunit G
MKKTIIESKVEIKASKDKVWEILADFGNVQNLSPGIAKSYVTSDIKTGLGASRHCDFTAMGAQVEEKIIEWDKGNSLKIELFDGKNLPMIRGMKALFKLKSTDNGTILTSVFEYHMNNMVGDLLNGLKMKKMNKKTWVLFMAGIKHYAETGENVNKETKLDLSSVQQKGA